MSDSPDPADGGNTQAASQLLPLVYDELRQLASHRLAHEKPGHTLQATALVHEAYLRLVGTAGCGPVWEGRAHFFAAAAQAMRRILVESARRKAADKHGGGRQRETTDALEVAAPGPRPGLLDLDEALVRLSGADPAAAELVQLRYFGGLSIPEAAEVLNVSPRTADRLWSYARAWLHQELVQDARPE
jgi:RNA polymerase sigma factor (TIGR02999 family)